MDIINQILGFISNFSIYILIVFTTYFIFRKLNFQGLRKEHSFDVVLIYLVFLIIYLKSIYLYQNIRNYSSLSEIIWNLNFPSNLINLILLYNFFISLFLSKFTRFSIFRILDSLSLNFLIILFLYGYKSSEVGLLLFLIFSVYFIEKKFKSGFITFLIVFTLTNYFLLYPKEENSLIFYTLLNTINALFIYKRLRYMTHTLSPEFIAQCKEKLLHRKEQLLKDLKVIDEDVDPDRDTGNAEYLDEVSEDLKVEKNYILKKDIEQILDSINAALKRVEDGTYGIDKKTGEPIDPARLKEFPEADENVK